MTSSIFDSLTVVVSCDMSAGAVARSSSAPPCSPWDSPSLCLSSDCLPPWPVDCLARYVHLTVHTDYLRSFTQRFRIAQSIIYQKSLSMPGVCTTLAGRLFDTMRLSCRSPSLSCMTQNPHAHNTLGLTPAVCISGGGCWLPGCAAAFLGVHHCGAHGPEPAGAHPSGAAVPRLDTAPRQTPAQRPGIPTRCGSSLLMCSRIESRHLEPL